MDESTIEKTVSSVRQRANIAKQFRSRTITCVLENPHDTHVGAVIRNVDALGITKLYQVTMCYVTITVCL